VCSSDLERRDGIESWWGICHAWAPAAFMEAEPLGTVERNGVTFNVSDQKALLMMQWDRSKAHLVGGRCNDKEVERDEETGRVISSDCRDLNAGSWHVIVGSLIGLNKRAMVIERTWDYEVWNQPLFGYEITLNKEITLDEAHTLLNVSNDSFGGTGEEVHGIKEGSNTAVGIINLVNGSTRPFLDEVVGLDARAAEALVAYRSGNDGVLGTNDDLQFSKLQEIDDTFYVGEVGFQKLSTYAQANGFVPAVYAYNDKAVRFVEIKMTSSWITEQHAMAERTDNVIERYTRHDRYHYILELDADGMIIGGEWVGSSIAAHPDFVWLPVGTSGGNPNIELDLIRDIVAEGRRNILGEDAEPEAIEVSSTTAVAIPDNDAEGVISTIKVDETGAVRTLTIDLDIKHTYRGDLGVKLRHGGVSIPVFNGGDQGQPWTNNVVLTAEVLSGFDGADVNGDWELIVTDTGWFDKGTVNSWGLNIQVER
jgi:subtilisin-like proprotein convertase family protein